MSSRDWRSIDIDALEPENHITKEELIPPNLPTYSNQEIQEVANQIRSQLSQGKFQQALELGLNNIPFGSTTQIKEIHQKTIFEIFCSIKNNISNNEIDEIIKNLNQEQQDNLIKYLYVNMSTSYGQKQGGLLLNWFEKIIEIVGIGSIARYLTDRRTV
ncbi:ARC15 [Candida pseudojiufengensis]|uniref:ARC15 n=1 Tax=Candida pseudojiufengensis TaxID=497109 RepID=UPI0022251FA4|nr:ARC15 [Candida pseudojiufengensis]KAI5962519.1 ARC15 [Candida pseudojiufengensis]